MQQTDPSKELMPGIQTSPETAAQSELRVRCPGCMKLYRVKTAEISEPRPQFACNSCDENFYLMYPESLGMDEIVGFPMTLQSTIEGRDIAPQQEELPPVEPQPEADSVVIPESVFHCPKCEAPRSGGENECAKCGVIFDRYKITEEESRPQYHSNEMLNMAWDRALENYDSDEGHDLFIEACGEIEQLDFAAYKYRRILNAHSGDEVALAMMKKIENLALAKSGLGFHEKKKSTNVRFRWTTILVALGIALMGMGYGIEQLRNLMGVGVALVFLSLALRIMFR